MRRNGQKPPPFIGSVRDTNVLKETRKLDEAGGLVLGRVSCGYSEFQVVRVKMGSKQVRIWFGNSREGSEL